jgi:hypothetical protein
MWDLNKELVDESVRAWVKFKPRERIIVNDDSITFDTSKPKPKTDGNRAARRKAKR